MEENIINIIAVIDYIENNLTEKLDLDSVAKAVNYSKYHLHRVFTEKLGLTIHDYVQRRQLTEAAKLLIFSDKPIIEIALTSGYDSQQAFTTIFKQMYKKSPKQFRDDEEFYPLQLRYNLHQNPAKFDEEIDLENNILLATERDIPRWMEFVKLVVDGFPYFNESNYLKQLNLSIQQNQAYVMKDGETIIGAFIFDPTIGSIDFLGVHPQYKKRKIAKVFLQKILNDHADDHIISITTFREGDKADLGYRETFQLLGFAESELLTEFGYPTQKFIISKNSFEGDKYE